jgi:hypothetical protein
MRKEREIDRKIDMQKWRERKTKSRRDSEGRELCKN